MSSPPYTVESITTEEDVSTLERDWDGLSRTVGAPNVFTAYDWFRAWYRQLSSTVGASKLRPHLLVLKKDGVVAAISPLVARVSTRFGLSSRRLQFVSRADYNDLVLGDDVAGQTQVVVDSLKQTADEWDLVDLRDLRDTGGSFALLEEALQRAGLFYRVIPEDERCPYLTIDGNWPQMIASRSSATRRSFRNRQARLDRLQSEGLRIRILDDPSAEPGLLGKMIALEAQKHVDNELSPPFLGVYPEVFASLFETLGPKGWLCVALMELNDRVLASHLLFRCGGKIWGYLTAYDHAYSKLSPGTMLIPQIIEYAFDRGYTEYDFLSGEEAYKMQWASGFHHRFRVVIWNRRLVSRLGAEAFVRLKLRPKASAHVPVAGRE